MGNFKSSSSIRGYVTVRQFGIHKIPVPTQNLALRDYAIGLGLTYILPMNEHKFSNCFMQLFASLHETDKNGRIAMCSIEMLPTDKVTRERVIELGISKNIEFHFLFENLIIRTEEDFDGQRMMISLKNLVKQTDKYQTQILTDIKNSSKYTHFNKV